MAVFNGTSMLLIVDGTAIGATNSFTLNVNSTNIDRSSKDSAGWTYRLYGNRDWNVTFDGLCDPSLTWNVEELFDLIDTRNQVFLEMAVIDGTGGGLKFTGYALASSLTLNAPKEEAVSISGTFEADGPLDKGSVVSS